MELGVHLHRTVGARSRHLPPPNSDTNAISRQAHRQGVRPMATLKAMEVDNIDFLIERMGQDCGPNQYLRELTQNAIEAVQRTGRSDGHIVWDHFVTDAGVRKLCIVDNGDGMTGLEMIQYINKL